MRRALKIIGWLLAALVLLIGAAGVAAYAFVTSDYVRAKIENHADALSGRRTKIGKISIDWGWVPHIRLDDFEVSNTDWGKADHLFKVQRVEFDIRLWPLFHGNFVLPTLILAEAGGLSGAQRSGRVELDPAAEPGGERNGPGGAAAAPASNAADR